MMKRIESLRLSAHTRVLKKCENLKELAAKCGAPYQRFLQQINRGKSQKYHRINYQWLQNDQEEAIRPWIKNLDENGIPLTAELI